MDERDKDLTGLFVRDLDEIALPPRGAWRRAPGRENTAMSASRYLLTAGAVAAVLAIALLVGVQLRDRSTIAANPSASPTPSLTSVPNIVQPSATTNPNVTPTPSAASSPASGGVYNDDFGFVIQSQPGTLIRKESASGAILPPFGVIFAVSPDGKQVAYFKAGPGQGGEGAQLRMFAVAGNSTEQTLVTLAADARGGGIAWSNDGAALLYSTETGSFGIGGGTNKATLNIYELTANGRHGTVIDTQANTGFLYRPIAWDRSVNLAAAGLTGEGGFMADYITVRINPDNTFNVQRTETRTGMGMGTVTASSDAMLVLGIETSGKINYWPLANVDAMKTASGTGQKGARWQPGSHRIGFLNASDGFVLFQADDGSATTPITGIKAGASIRTFRVDGTAVVLTFLSGPSSPGSATQYAIYRLSDGASVAFEDVGSIAASVRLR